MLSAVERVLIGRAAVALAGMLTVTVLFRMARRVTGTEVALLAAALLAVAILPVSRLAFRND